MKLHLLFIFTLAYSFSYAQNKIVDSLQNLLQTQKADTNKVKTYCELIRIVRNYDFDEAERLIDSQITLSQKLHYTWGIGRAQNSRGLIAYAKHDFDDGQKFLRQAAASFFSIRDYNWLCAVYNNMSLLYAEQNKSDSAIYYSRLAQKANQRVKDSAQYLKNEMAVYASLSPAFFAAEEYDSCIYYNNKTIEIADRFNDKMRMADCYATNGQVLILMNQYKESEEYMLKALEIYNDAGAGNMAYQIKSGLGTIYYSMGKYDESKRFTIESIRDELGQKDSGLLMQNYMNLGLVEFGQANYNDALKYFSQGMEAGKNKGDPFSMKQLEQYTGETYLQLKDYNGAIEYFKKAIAEDTSDLKIKYECLASMSKAYEGLDEFQLALTTYRQSTEISQVLFDSAKNKTISELLLKYETEKKQRQIDQLTGEKQISDLKIARQQQDIIQSDLLAQKQKDQLALENLEIEKNNSELESKELVIRASDVQLQSEEKEKELQAAIMAKESQKKKFAYVAIAAIIFLSALSFYRYRHRRKLQSQQEMLNERLRISRELHDDIGSTLGSISIYSEVAKTRVDRNQNSDEVLAKIGSTSRELIDKMSDIVWSINPNNESFEQVQNRMQTFAAMILTPRNIAYEFMTDKEVKKLQFSMEQRKNIFLIFKEAVYNIVKYASANKVSISLKNENGLFRMLIHDDGRGFDTQSISAYNGNGIKNMKARAKDIGAELNIQSQLNDGSRIELIMNF